MPWAGGCWPPSSASSGVTSRRSAAAGRNSLPLVEDHDQDANAEAPALVERLGLDTIDVGGLDESWRFEPDIAAYLTLYASPELKSLEDLWSTPAVPLAAHVLRDLIAGPN